MENQHLTYFKVENFKRFESLEINDIGQFNLIVGDNNVGKTSVLESLLLNTQNHNQFLSNLFNSLIQVRKILFANFSFLDSFDYISPLKKEKNKPIKYTYVNNEGVNNYFSIDVLNKQNLSEQEIQQLGTKNIIHQTSHYVARIINNSRQDLKYTSYYKEVGTYTDYYPLACFGLSYQADIINFFSEVSKLTPGLNFLLDELKSQIPDIESIEISSAIIKDSFILAIREKNFDELKPISFYGDGLNKFFRYILEIFQCIGKRLMIDEIDTGIHYSRMRSSFKSLFSLSNQNNVQIFATTHSKECLQYYKEAIEELEFQDKARIIKLVEHKNKEIKAYTYTYPQFEQSLDNDNEIR